MLFIRVKDPVTRHEFDVPETDKRIEAGLLLPVKPKLYPPWPHARVPHPYVASKGVTPKPSEAAEIKEAHSG